MAVLVPDFFVCCGMWKHIHCFEGRRVELTGWIWGDVVETGLLKWSRVDRNIDI